MTLKCLWCGTEIKGPVEFKGRVRWGEPEVIRLVYACSIKELSRSGYPQLVCALSILVLEQIEITLKIIMLPEFETEQIAPIEVREINEWCRRRR